MRGRALAAQGQAGPALADYQRAQALDASYPSAYLAQGNLAYARREFADAADFYRKALALQELPTAYYALGTALFYQGQTDASVRALERAVQLAESSGADASGFRLVLGIVLEATGEQRAAAEEYRQILALGTGSEAQRREARVRLDGLEPATPWPSPTATSSVPATPRPSSRDRASPGPATASPTPTGTASPTVRPWATATGGGPTPTPIVPTAEPTLPTAEPTLAIAEPTLPAAATEPAPTAMATSVPTETLLPTVAPPTQPPTTAVPLATATLFPTVTFTWAPTVTAPPLSTIKPAPTATWALPTWTPMLLPTNPPSPSRAP